MKEFITIKNFGPLKNIEDLEIKQFTILIGESASGKSTLMKVVAMMRYQRGCRARHRRRCLRLRLLPQVPQAAGRAR